jgi:hypothetical protein
MFLGSKNLIVLSEKIDIATGSEKIKMADAKTGRTCISDSLQASKDISTLTACFQCRELSGAVGYAPS